MPSDELEGVECGMERERIRGPSNLKPFKPDMKNWVTFGNFGGQQPLDLYPLHVPANYNEFKISKIRMFANL